MTAIARASRYFCPEAKVEVGNFYFSFWTFCSSFHPPNEVSSIFYHRLSYFSIPSFFFPFGMLYYEKTAKGVDSMADDGKWELSREEINERVRKQNAEKDAKGATSGARPRRI